MRAIMKIPKTETGRSVRVVRRNLNVRGGDGGSSGVSLSNDTASGSSLAGCLWRLNRNSIPPMQSSRGMCHCQRQGLPENLTAVPDRACVQTHQAQHVDFKEWVGNLQHHLTFRALRLISQGGTAAV